jgi:hypothetical protein
MDAAVIDSTTVCQARPFVKQLGSKNDYTQLTMVSGLLHYASNNIILLDKLAIGLSQKAEEKRGCQERSELCSVNDFPEDVGFDFYCFPTGLVGRDEDAITYRVDTNVRVTRVVAYLTQVPQLLTHRHTKEDHEALESAYQSMWGIRQPTSASHIRTGDKHEYHLQLMKSAEATHIYNTSELPEGQKKQGGFALRIYDESCLHELMNRTGGMKIAQHGKLDDDIVASCRMSSLKDLFCEIRVQDPARNCTDGEVKAFANNKALYATSNSELVFNELVLRINEESENGGVWCGVGKTVRVELVCESALKLDIYSRQRQSFERDTALASYFDLTFDHCAIDERILDKGTGCESCAPTAISNGNTCLRCPHFATKSEYGVQCNCFSGMLGIEQKQQPDCDDCDDYEAKLMMKCVSCPNGGNCQQPGTTFRSIKSKQGYWQDLSHFEKSQERLMFERCGDGAATHALCERGGQAESACREFHTGPLCRMCIVGENTNSTKYAKNEKGLCTPCADAAELQRSKEQLHIGLNAWACALFLFFTFFLFPGVADAFAFMQVRCRATLLVL